MGQGVRNSEGRTHGVLQGTEAGQGDARSVLARGSTARHQRSRRGGGCQLHQEEARVPTQVISFIVFAYINVYHVRRSSEAPHCACQPETNIESLRSTLQTDT